MKKSCGIFTNIAPFYSRPLWYELTASENVDYTFYSAPKGFLGISTIDINESKIVSKTGTLNWVFLKNFLFGNILFYQIGIISKCLKTDHDVYILSGEMNSISSWVAALICKVRKKPLLFWGHGLYGNETYFKKIVRLLYYKIADYHLVYGNRSRELLIKSGFNSNKIFTVYNSLDYSLHEKLYKEINKADLNKLKEEMFNLRNDLPIVIFIGRLTKEKKISYLLKAISLSKEKGNSYNCLIVGGGTESDNLIHLVESLGIKDNICFYGPNYEEKLNAMLIMMSECCVSPGNVGLTAIHSLSLGTPVITHGNMCNQGPEAEAVIHGETGFYFKENDVVSLSNVIDDMIINKKKLYMESKCIDQVKKYWNPSKQASVFDNAVLKAILG